MKNPKLISIVTPTYNEEGNIGELCQRIFSSINLLSNRYRYEHIIIDNCSTDNTVNIAKDLIINYPHLKIIVNTRNFGPVRSPYYGLLSAQGAAVILLSSDLQDPPEIICELIAQWELGYDVVMAVKPSSQESISMNIIRKLFYRTINFLSEIPLVNNATGAGLYDHKVIETLRRINDPYPYFRGLVCELGFKRSTIEFIQPLRKNGTSKASFYGLLDQALLAMTKHSKMPLRIMTLFSLIFGLLAFIMATVFIFLKLFYWNDYGVGVATTLVVISLVSSIQFFFFGLIGEYLGAILTQTRSLPLVIEQERINFNNLES